MLIGFIIRNNSKSFLFIRCVSRSHLSLKSAPNLRRAPVKRSGFTSVTSEDCTEEEDTFGELPAGDFLNFTFCNVSQKSFVLMTFFNVPQLIDPRLLPIW